MLGASVVSLKLGFTINEQHQHNGSNKMATSRQVNLHLVMPAIMAGVQIWLPNFKAKCGLMKL